ncbi:inner nuclear membrane protein enriched at telomere/subtelomere region [Ceratobasidium sp. 423]|nr:inner nuclear membrane protein enriched at telomere/subtelomere region [Ceratobasidium sp. 423]
MSRLSASEVINRGDYLKSDFEPSTLTIPHLLSVLTYHGIKYPSPHTKGKLIEVFNNELKPRSAELLRERQAREHKKPSSDGILDGHTGQAIQPPEPVPLRRSTRRSSRQPSESVPEPAPVTKRRRSSAEPTTTRSSSRNLHQPPAEPILVEESEQEEQAKTEDEFPRRSSRTKGPSLRNRRQSAGLSDANDSAWEDNNVFQSGAEDSPVKPVRREPKTRTGPPPVTRRVSKRSSMSAPPQLQPPSSRSPEPQREITPEVVVEPQTYNEVPSSPAFVQRLPTTVGTPAGGLRTFNPPASQIRKSIAVVAVAPPTQDEPSSEEEEGEEETQKPTNVADQSRGDELVEAAIDVEEPSQDSLTSDTAEEDQSYEQIDEPVDYNSAVAQRIASIGQDSAAGRALVQRADIKVPPVVPRWLSLILGFGFSILLSVTASYKTESASIGWCETGTNTNSIIAERKIAQAARYECAERLYLNSTLGAVGLIESGEGSANRQEVLDGLMGGECTPLPLLPIPHPWTCTPCPEHATCTPPYEITCHPTYILKQHPLDTIPGLRALASGLPGFGAVAFPPQCVEDDARKRKVSGVAKGMATYLETVKGERVCEGSVVGGKPIDGGESRKFGVKVNDLAELVLKEMKRSTNRDDYHEIVETALNDLEKYGWVERSIDSKGDQWVASKRLSMGTLCRVKVGARETWNEWQMHFYTLIATIFGAFWTRSKLASKRRESRRIAELAAVALDLVRNQEIAHHTDAVRAPHAYVSSLHLRDMVLQEEHNVHERMRLWSKVAKIVEGNANIRANIEEVAGDETRVWRWIGACKFYRIWREYH